VVLVAGVQIQVPVLLVLEALELRVKALQEAEAGRAVPIGLLVAAEVRVKRVLQIQALKMVVMAVKVFFLT
jgi:hypothetical protein